MSNLKQSIKLIGVLSEVVDIQNEENERGEYIRGRFNLATDPHNPENQNVITVNFWQNKFKKGTKEVAKPFTDLLKILNSPSIANSQGQEPVKVQVTNNNGLNDSSYITAGEESRLIESFRVRGNFYEIPTTVTKYGTLFTIEGYLMTEPEEEIYAGEPTGRYFFKFLSLDYYDNPRIFTIFIPENSEEIVSKINSEWSLYDFGKMAGAIIARPTTSSASKGLIGETDIEETRTFYRTELILRKPYAVENFREDLLDEEQLLELKKQYGDNLIKMKTEREAKRNTGEEIHSASEVSSPASNKTAEPVDDNFDFM